jgi:CO dehydrogenase maturation factor
MCAAHATVRGLLHQVTEQAGTVVIDLEAGLEHLSRGTPRYVDTLVLVAEPYFKSMETAARCKALGEDLGIPRIVAVANKLRGVPDAAAMRRFFEDVGLPLLAMIADDAQILEADRRGLAPLDYDPTAPAVTAIVELAGALAGDR